MSKIKKIEHVIFCLSVMLWGAVLLYFYQHEKLQVYIAAKFHIYVLIGGLAALVIGLFNLATMHVKTDCGHDHGDGEEDGCCGHDDDAEGGHSHDSDLNPFAALVLIALPLFFSISATQHKLSDEYAESISGADVDAQTFNFIDIPPFTLETLEQSRDKAADGAFQLNLLELFYTAGDTEQMAVFDGLSVETEAKLRNEPNRNDNGKRMRLYRLFMTCCAADTKAIPLSIEFDGELPDISHHAWVRVGGTMGYEEVDGVTYPVLKVNRIEEIPVPEGEWSEGLQK